MHIQKTKGERAEAGQNTGSSYTKVFCSGFLIYHRRKKLLPLWEKTIIKLG